LLRWDVPSESSGAFGARLSSAALMGLGGVLGVRGSCRRCLDDGVSLVDSRSGSLAFPASPLALARFQAGLRGFPLVAVSLSGRRCRRLRVSGPPHLRLPSRALLGSWHSTLRPRDRVREMPPLLGSVSSARALLSPSIDILPCVHSRIVRCRSILRPRAATSRGPVPSSRFLTASTAFSARKLRACCIPLPNLGFAAFPGYRSLHP